MANEPGALGKKLREIRLAAGLSKVALAKRSGVARSTINRIELGEQDTATLPVLERLAKACGRPLSALTDAVVRSAKLDDVIDEWIELERARPITRPTAEEIAWLRRLPQAVWTELPPTVATIEGLVELYRASRRR